MGNLYYAVAVLMLIVWAIAFFAYEAGVPVHILPLMSVILFVLSLRETTKQKSPDKAN